MHNTQGTEAVILLIGRFEKSARCFDNAIVAARRSATLPNYTLEDARKGMLLEISDRMRLLKTEARAVIGILATSDLAAHRDMANACRVRTANAVNLHRAVTRCIRHGTVPPLPALYSAADARNDAPEWAHPWAYHQALSMACVMAWSSAWSAAWTLGRGCLSSLH